MTTNNNTEHYSLESIAGYEEEKAEAIKIINLFKNYDNLKELGVSIPKGLILSGMPGVGKTLMARVIAAESNVPLFEYEAEDDETPEKGILNLKALFEKARNNAPSIVLIDELDEIICTFEFKSDYTRSILKTLLTELDGIKNTDGILTIATTNHFEEIPVQLMRSGRMDKHIEFDLPNQKSREAILNLYAKDKPLLKNVKMKNVASKANFCSGADLKTLINETMLQAISSGKKIITEKDFYSIIPTIMFKGIIKNTNKESNDQVCYHELGHFMCEYVLNNKVSEISVEKVGRVEGHIMRIEYDVNDKIKSFEECKNDAIVALGGHAAEKVMLGQTYTSVGCDFRKFATIIENMATAGMFGAEFIFSTVSRNDPIKFASAKSPATTEIKTKCFSEYLDIAVNIINENKDLIEFLFVKLKEEKRLSQEEIIELLEDFKNNKTESAHE